MLFKKKQPEAIKIEIKNAGWRMNCESCRVMDVAMQIMTMLQFPRSNGTLAVGIDPLENTNLRSIIRSDRETKDIIINEDELMRAIMLANPGQKPRKLKLISAEEFETRFYPKIII